MVEGVRVPAQVLYVSQALEDVRVEVNAGEGRHAGLVVGAEPERQAAALPDKLFQVCDERAADAPTLKVRAHYQRVQLPHVAAVGGYAADPAEDRAALVQSYPIYAMLAERFAYLFQRGVHVRPGFWPIVPEALDEKFSRLPDVLLVAGVEVGDREPRRSLTHESSRSRSRASMMAATPLELTISPDRIRPRRSSTGTLISSTSSCSSGSGSAVLSTSRARKR